MTPEAEKFCAITGAADSVADQYLAACNNNLEMALNMYMETGSLAGSLSSDVSAAAAAADEAAAAITGGSQLRAPMAQTVTQLTPDAGAIYSQMEAAASRAIVQPFADHRAAMMDAHGVGGRASKRTLHEMYRPPTDLLHAGSLESAMQQARGADKWLLVDLQDVSEFGCQLLNRDIWSQPAVRSVLEHNCVFLQLDSRSPAGRRFAVNYRAPGGSPFVALLDPVTGEQRIRFAQGQLRHLDAFLERLTEFLAEFEKPECPPADAEVETGAGAEDTAARLAEVADDAAEAPASKRARQRLPSGDVTETAKNSTEAEAVTAAEAAEEAEELRRAVAASRLEEEDHRRWLGDPSEPDRCRLLVRYPDGSRSSLDWPASSRLRALTGLLSRQGYPTDEFELLVTHPRRLLSQEQAGASLRELGLCPSDTVFVQAK